MSFAALLTHDLTIVRTAFDDTEGTRTDYGQPLEQTTEIVAKGLIQPKTAREIDDSRSAGAHIATHTIFLSPMLLYGSDAIVDADLQRYEITGIRPQEFGTVPHIEVDAFAVTSSNDNFVAVGS